MADGAHLNIDAEGAMMTIVGGKEAPTPMTDEEFESMIRNASTEGDLDYGTMCNATARLILEAYEKHPQLQDMTDEREYLRNPDGKVDWGNPISTNTTLTDVINKIHDKDSDGYKNVLSDLTGFMWGWAVNAARKILNLGPLPNPALMTFTTKGS